MKGRYDYIRYDAQSAAAQASYKAQVDVLQAQVDDAKVCGPAMAALEGKALEEAVKAAQHYQQLAIDHLEAFYMNVGKMIRTAQVIRTGTSVEEPHRGESKP